MKNRTCRSLRSVTLGSDNDLMIRRASVWNSLEGIFRAVSRELILQATGSSRGII